MRLIDVAALNTERHVVRGSMYGVWNLLPYLLIAALSGLFGSAIVHNHRMHSHPTETCSGK